MTKIVRDLHIVCFASENWDYPGFQQSIMRGLALNNRLLFFNAIGLRKASAKHREYRLYFSKLKRLFSGTKQISENVLVHNPFLIPYLYNDRIDRINRILIKWQLSKLQHKFKLKECVLWVGTPTAAPFIKDINYSLLVYNPVDRYCAFSFVNPEGIRRYERIVAESADLIIATSDAIYEDMKKYNNNCRVITHGVHFNHFNKATINIETPREMDGLIRPVIGFYGKIDEWVNLELIKKIAAGYTQASIVLLGRIGPSTDSLTGIKNIYFLGHKPFDILPHYLKCFDVCIIPFHKNELTNGIDPIKLREYLSAGKPVVATDTPEIRKYSGLVYIAKDDAEFLHKVAEALRENNDHLMQKRTDAVRDEDWSQKVKLVNFIISQKLAERKGRVSLNPHKFFGELAPHFSPKKSKD